MTSRPVQGPDQAHSDLKHVVVAISTTGKPNQYLTHSGYGLTPVLGETFLFDSPRAAQKRINDFVAGNHEREMAVRLTLGQVSLALVHVDAPAPTTVRAGFILRRKDGAYYCGPKGRDANTFQEAYYRYKPNSDLATVFPTEAMAALRAEGILTELRKAVRNEDKHRHVYERCVRDGSCTIVDEATGRPVRSKSLAPGQ